MFKPFSPPPWRTQLSKGPHPGIPHHIQRGLSADESLAAASPFPAATHEKQKVGHTAVKSHTECLSTWGLVWLLSNFPALTGPGSHSSSPKPILCHA